MVDLTSTHNPSKTLQEKGNQGGDNPSTANSVMYSFKCFSQGFYLLTENYSVYFLHKVDVNYYSDFQWKSEHGKFK